MSTSTIIIDHRFCGPPSSGNGGWTAGLLAVVSRIPGAVTVSLRQPPPLDRELHVVTDGDTASLLDGETTVATAKPGGFSRQAPAFVDIATAREAEDRFRGRDRHPFPTCFTCGTQREVGDGLRLASGPISDSEVDRHTTACTWTPEPTHADADGVVLDPMIWAALDCPGGWSSDIDFRPMVLGTVTGEHQSMPQVGETYVVCGQMDAIDGRKTFSSTALYDQSGALMGRAEQVWIQVDPALFGGTSA